MRESGNGDGRMEGENEETGEKRERPRPGRRASIPGGAAGEEAWGGQETGEQPGLIQGPSTPKPSHRAWQGRKKHPQPSPTCQAHPFVREVTS